MYVPTYGVRRSDGSWPAFSKVGKWHTADRNKGGNSLEGFGSRAGIYAVEAGKRMGFSVLWNGGGRAMWDESMNSSALGQFPDCQ